jgi:hypothetical protein
MSEEKKLLDNLHGRVDALTALCAALIASHKDVGVVMALFLKELEGGNKSDSSARSDHYYLGMKAVHDQLLRAVKQVQLEPSGQIPVKSRKR